MPQQLGLLPPSALMVQYSTRRASRLAAGTVTGTRDFPLLPQWWWCQQILRTEPAGAFPAAAAAATAAIRSSRSSSKDDFAATLWLSCCSPGLAQKVPRQLLEVAHLLPSVSPEVGSVMEIKKSYWLLVCTESLFATKFPQTKPYLCSQQSLMLILGNVRVFRTISKRKFRAPATSSKPLTGGNITTNIVLRTIGKRESIRIARPPVHRPPVFCDNRRCCGGNQYNNIARPHCIPKKDWICRFTSLSKQRACLIIILYRPTYQKRRATRPAFLLYRG